MTRTVLLLLPLLLAADIKLPKEVKGRTGAFIEVPATCDTPVGWFAPDLDAAGIPYLSIAPVSLVKNSRTALLIGPPPGRYRLIAFTADKESTAYAECIIDTGGSPPPGPTPVPPNDPLVAALLPMYAADLSPDKAKNKAALTDVYKQATKEAADPAYATAGQLMAAVSKVSQSQLPKDALQPLRAKLAETMVAELPTEPDTMLTAELRTKYAKMFARIASVLEAVK